MAAIRGAEKVFNSPGSPVRSILRSSHVHT